MSKFYFCFTENNDWEGETWNFYLPLTTEQYRKIDAAIANEEYNECYKLYSTAYLEEEIDDLVESDNSNCTYMAAHNKCGEVKLPDEIELDKDDIFYKGGCWSR